MHELSLCRSIAGIVDRAAAGRPVASITLDVGELRQVVPQTLQYCWGLVTQTTALDGSTLVINRIQGVVECEGCGEHTRMVEAITLVCSGCGGTEVRVVEGEEFLVRSLELKE